MKKFIIILCVIPTFGYCNLFTLKQILALAEQKNENLKKAQSKLVEASEKHSQSVGSLFPKVGLRGSYQELDPVPQSPTTPRGLVRTTQYSAAINFVQPLFRGLKEYSVFKQTNLNLDARQLNIDGARISLRLILIELYANIVITKLDIENLKLQEKHTKERVLELQNRVRIGKSRKSELYILEAQLMNIHGQLLDNEKSMEEHKAKLYFYTENGIEVKFEDLELEIPKELPHLENFISKISERPDLKSLRFEVDVASENIDQAKGGHLPNLDLGGNYYLTRTGILQDSKWDLQLTLTLPIFEGGVTQSIVRENVEKKNQAYLTYVETNKQIERDIKTLYQNYLFYVEKLKTLSESVIKSEAAYKENKKDFYFGLSTNLEVLQTLNTYLENKKNYDRLKVQIFSTYYILKTATGEIL